MKGWTIKIDGRGENRRYWLRALSSKNFTMGCWILQSHLGTPRPSLSTALWQRIMTSPLCPTTTAMSCRFLLTCIKLPPLRPCTADSCAQDRLRTNVEIRTMAIFQKSSFLWPSDCSADRKTMNDTVLPAVLSFGSVFFYLFVFN